MTATVEVYCFRASRLEDASSSNSNFRLNLNVLHQHDENDQNLPSSFLNEFIDRDSNRVCSTAEWPAAGQLHRRGVGKSRRRHDHRGTIAQLPDIYCFR